MMAFAFLLALAPHAQCFATVSTVAEGSVLAAEHLAPVACKADAPRAPLRYDRRRGIVIAAAPLPAGSYIGRLAVPGGARVTKGDVLTLRSTAGPVVIERQVTALQPGRSGHRLFVRDVAGKVFAVPLVLESGQ